MEPRRRPRRDSEPGHRQNRGADELRGRGRLQEMHPVAHRVTIGSTSSWLHPATPAYQGGRKLKQSSQNSIVAAVISVIAHLAVVLVILALPPAARQPSYYVLAYLVDNSGAGDGRAEDPGAPDVSPHAKTGTPPVRRDAARRGRGAPHCARGAH